MRSTCKHYFPKILKFFDSIYGKHTTIYYQDDFKLMSSRGFQQGDGLATMFSLVTYHAFYDVKDFKDIYFIKLFFDDDRAVVDWNNVGNTLACIEKILHGIGLRLNRNKTKVYTKNTNRRQRTILPRSMGHSSDKRVSILKCLGTFIGNKGKTKEFLESKIKEFDKFMKIVKMIPKKQTGIDNIEIYAFYSQIYQHLIHYRSGILTRLHPGNRQKNGQYDCLHIGISP